ncbi:hypothetical protein LY622_09435 [Halomonas sp. M5N1S17]|uniref:hypothetical protein n=1 Tax=Halomonas alkalisoli TaxID=2907158 RepID=UPI001F2AA81E|nr:hypothetical protein [Halomonas alkalisoli]MCE9663661.1 hypothetical protein [Halomonas alkalisoli]
MARSLYDGLSLVIVALGLFALPEIIDLLARGGAIAERSKGLGHGWVQGAKEECDFTDLAEDEETPAFYARGLLFFAWMGGFVGLFFLIGAPRLIYPGVSRESCSIDAICMMWPSCFG